MVWRKEDNSYKKSAFVSCCPRGNRNNWRRPITNKLNAYGGAISTRVGRMHINLAEAQRWVASSSVAKRSAVGVNRENFAVLNSEKCPNIGLDPLLWRVVSMSLTIFQYQSNITLYYLIFIQPICNRVGVGAGVGCEAMRIIKTRVKLWDNQWIKVVPGKLQLHVSTHLFLLLRIATYSTIDMWKNGGLILSLNIDSYSLVVPRVQLMPHALNF